MFLVAFNFNRAICLGFWELTIGNKENYQRRRRRITSFIHINTCSIFSHTLISSISWIRWSILPGASLANCLRASRIGLYPEHMDHNCSYNIMIFTCASADVTIKNIVNLLPGGWRMFLRLMLNQWWCETVICINLKISVELHHHPWWTVSTLGSSSCCHCWLYWMISYILAPKTLHRGDLPTITDVDRGQALARWCWWRWWRW